MRRASASGPTGAAHSDGVVRSSSVPDARPLRDAGALRQWREELKTGVRTKYTFDALRKAACRQVTAGDFERLGLLAITAELRREAAEIIIPATSQLTAA